MLVLALGACTSVQGNLNGRVAVTVSGLPEGVSPRVVLQGNGMEKEVTGSAVLEVPEGDYVVTADSVTGPQGERYDPVVENAKFRVEYGKTVEVKVTYNLVTETLPASLTVLVQGLPSGVEASVTVYGPGGDELDGQADHGASRVEGGDLLCQRGASGGCGEGLHAEGGPGFRNASRWG